MTFIKEDSKSGSIPSLQEIGPLFCLISFNSSLLPSHSQQFATLQSLVALTPRSTLSQGAFLSFHAPVSRVQARLRIQHAVS